MTRALCLLPCSAVQQGWLANLVRCQATRKAALASASVQWAAAAAPIHSMLISQSPGVANAATPAVAESTIRTASRMTHVRRRSPPHRRRSMSQRMRRLTRRHPFGSAFSTKDGPGGTSTKKPSSSKMRANASKILPQRSFGGNVTAMVSLSGSTSVLGLRQHRHSDEAAIDPLSERRPSDTCSIMCTGVCKTRLSPSLNPNCFM